mgnify:CR=1 FL=1
MFEICSDGMMCTWYGDVMKKSGFGIKAGFLESEHLYNLVFLDVNDPQLTLCEGNFADRFSSPWTEDSALQVRMDTNVPLLGDSALLTFGVKEGGRERETSL